MSDLESTLSSALHTEAEQATRTLDTVQAGQRLSARLDSIDRHRRQRTWGTALALASAAALAVAVVVVSQTRHSNPPPAGGQEQRISITTPKGNGFEFVLRPLSPGPLRPDSGSKIVPGFGERQVMRDGERMTIDTPTMTYNGQRGSFTMDVVVAWVAAGHDNSIGTGTWRITTGTGAYRHLEGHGRIAVIWPGTSDWLTSKAEGLVDLNG